MRWIAVRTDPDCSSSVHNERLTAWGSRVAITISEATPQDSTTTSSSTCHSGPSKSLTLTGRQPPTKDGATLHSLAHVAETALPASERPQVRLLTHRSPPSPSLDSHVGFTG